MESEEFMLLPSNQLIDIISSDELNVRSEEQVFNAVMAWVKYKDTTTRWLTFSLWVLICVCVITQTLSGVAKASTVKLELKESLKTDFLELQFYMVPGMGIQ